MVGVMTTKTSLKAIDAAIAFFDGNASALARACGVTPGAVLFWRDGRRKVPADLCPRIEAVTGGAVTCEELRPDVLWGVLRRKQSCE